MVARLSGCEDRTVGNTRVSGGGRATQQPSDAQSLNPGVPSPGMGLGAGDTHRSVGWVTAVISYSCVQGLLVFAEKVELSQSLLCLRVASV